MNVPACPGPRLLDKKAHSEILDTGVTQFIGTAAEHRGVAQEWAESPAPERHILAEEVRVFSSRMFVGVTSSSLVETPWAKRVQAAQ